ncbi:MAG: hypothetical protein OEY96_11305 [Gammaproteobacteria bacterium]|nr:hypothetical protein [Gammaproteobacteria bacterium]
MMSLKRAKQILASYGADSSQWPQDEKAALLNLIEQNLELQQIIEVEKEADESLNQMINDSQSEDVNFENISALHHQIIQNLPEQAAKPNSDNSSSFGSQLLEYLRKPLIAMPALAASLYVASFMFFTPISTVSNEDDLQDVWAMMAEDMNDYMAEDDELALLLMQEPELAEDWDGF